MSIKKLFDSENKNTNFSDYQDEKTTYELVESRKNAQITQENDDTIVPRVNYENPSTFAKFGSAELYYQAAFDRIINYYPYDGSHYEKEKFYNGLSEIEKYVFNKKYPRSTGYINLSATGWGTLDGSITSDGYGTPATPEYITFKGGPGTGSNSTGKLTDLMPSDFSSKLDRANIYDEDLYTSEGLPSDYGLGSRLSNLRSNFDNGVTLEFWLKKDSFDVAKTEKEVVVDIWNNYATSSNSYGRITLELTGAASVTPFILTVQSGTTATSVFTASIGESLTTTSLEAWQHYAVSMQNSGSSFVAKLYVNGKLNDTETFSGNISELNSKNMMGRIGGLLTAPSGSSAVAGAGKLSGSIDEFRFWKEARNSKLIDFNYFNNVDGGTNTDISNTTLGVYYKFNEGITLTSSSDSIVLDYAGRITNGVWTGYTGQYSRNTGSAMVESNAARSEYLEPIIRANHPSYKSIRSSLITKGRNFDLSNNSMFMNYAPEWVIAEHDDLGNKNLQYVSHIFGSYMDRLYLFAGEIPKLKAAEYLSGSSLIDPKAYPLGNHLPQSLGLYVPEIFVDAKIYELLYNRKFDKEFENNLQDTKNSIYLNIYNNLANIFKAKGTEKAIRNVFRCYNIDDKLIKFKSYADETTYEIKNNIREFVVDADRITLNNTASTQAVVYQKKNSANANSSGYISGSYKGPNAGVENPYGFTMESSIVFPRYYAATDKVNRTQKRVSLFGLHTVDTGSNASLDGTTTTLVANDYANFQVYAIRDEKSSKNVRFALSSSGPEPIAEITSSTFPSVYDDNKWNLSVRLKPSNFPFSGFVTGAASYTYDVIFRGINHTQGVINDSFTVTGSMSFAVGSKFLQSPKRVYVGARRENLTGTVLQTSDVLFDTARVWTKYISDTNIEQHLLERDNSAISGTIQRISPLDTNNNSHELLNINTLALDWNFANVTGSDATGNFSVQDFSSGSATIRNNYSWLGKITGYQHSGYGYGFPASSTNIIDKSYVTTFKFVDPEENVSSDMINILSDDDEYFETYPTPPDYIFTVEKSMYSAISGEMLQFVAGVSDFNTIIGTPINRYRSRYKDLDLLKEIFFRRVTTVSEVEKFVEYYKWLDDSIASILNQLMPASSQYTNDLLNVVESHALERNKYENKFPTVELRETNGKFMPDAALYGYGEMNYRYDIGSSPISGASGRPTTIHGDYWFKRSERDASEIGSGNSNIDATRDILRDVINSEPAMSQSAYTLKTVGGTKYAAKKYERKNFIKLSNIKAESLITPYAFGTLKGGVNFEPSKKIDFTYSALRPAGPIDREGGRFVPQNILLGFSSDFVPLSENRDPVRPPNKKVKRFMKVMMGREHISGSDYTDTKSTISFPFNIISSSLATGYQSIVQSRVPHNIEITNLHNDVYGPDMEKPMQGPFTEYAVGGHQSRHVAINFNATDTWHNRPEAWYLLLGTCNAGLSGAIGMVGPDYPWPDQNTNASPPYPATGGMKAAFYRDHVAKRPVNIKNIRLMTGSTILGNFRNNYEIVNLVGANSNPRKFIDNQPILSPVVFSDRMFSSSITNTMFDVRRLDDEHFEFITDYSLSYLSGNTNKTVITNRFGSPGGIETGKRYSDFRSTEFSPYNVIGYRNLSVIKPLQIASGSLSETTGSGGLTRIRVVDFAKKDFGLVANQARPSGKFGRDIRFQANPGASYNQIAASHKIHRNTLDKVKIISTTEVPIYSGLQLTNDKSLLLQNETKNSTLLHTASTGHSTTPETLAIAITSSASTGFSWSGWIKFGEQGPSDEETIFAVGSRQGNVPLFRVSKTHGGTPATYKIKVVVRTIANSDGTTGVQGLTNWEWDMSGSNLIADWNHYALVWDPVANGSLATNNETVNRAAKLYFNGTLQGSASLTVGSRAYYNNNYASTTLNVRGFTSQARKGNTFMSIGGDCQGAGATRALTASIDEFSFWSTELNSTQVGTLYNGGIPCDIVGEISASNLPAASNLWEWLRFETGNGRSAIHLNSANLGTYLPNSNQVVGYQGEAFVPLAVTGGALAMDNPTNTSLGFPLTGCVRTLDRYETVHTFATRSSHDNYFIQHPIPRSTKNYRWITGTVLTTPYGLGYAPRSFMYHYSSSTGFVNAEAMTFLSQSDFGSRIFGANRRFGVTSGDGFMPNDFVGLNINIVQQISTASMTIGNFGYNASSEEPYQGVSASTTYLNNDFVPGSFLNATARGAMLNGIIHNRDGVWGESSWKNSRNAENRLLKYMRRNNLISTTATETSCHEYSTTTMPALSVFTPPLIEIGVETLVGPAFGFAGTATDTISSAGATSLGSYGGTTTTTEGFHPTTIRSINIGATSVYSPSTSGIEGTTLERTIITENMSNIARSSYFARGPSMTFRDVDSKVLEPWEIYGGAEPFDLGTGGDSAGPPTEDVLKRYVGLGKAIREAGVPETPKGIHTEDSSSGPPREGGGGTPTTPELPKGTWNAGFGTRNLGPVTVPDGTLGGSYTGTGGKTIYVELDIRNKTLTLGGTFSKAAEDPTPYKIRTFAPLTTKTSMSEAMGPTIRSSNTEKMSARGQGRRVYKPSSFNNNKNVERARSATKLNFNMNAHDLYNTTKVKHGYATLRALNTDYERLYYGNKDFAYLPEFGRADIRTKATQLQKILKTVDKNSARMRINWLSVGQNIYPSSRNLNTTAVTNKSSFANNFWRTARANRNTGSTNSLGVTTTLAKNTGIAPISQSIFCMDAPSDFLTRTGPPNIFSGNVGSIRVAVLTSGSAGELQNTYTHCFTSSYFTASQEEVLNKLSVGALYSRKHTLSNPTSLNSVISKRTYNGGGVVTINTSWNPSNQIDVFGGEAEFQPELAGITTRQNGVKNTKTFVSAASEPWYDSYTEFRDDGLKGTTKAMSILPEFRVSEHIDDYLTFGTNDKSKIDTFELPETGIDSTSGSFYVTYSNSDFLKDVTTIRNQSDLDPSEIRLKFKAAIKFNPYKGFYPAQRTMQLVEKFNEAYIDSYRSVINGNFNILRSDNNNFALARNIITPLFAPGLLYNSIKSSVAVDYPILSNRTRKQRQLFSGSIAFDDGVTDSLNNWAIVQNISASNKVYNPDIITLSSSFFDQRIPFEGLIEPHTFIGNTALYDLEAHPSASTEPITGSETNRNIFASLDGKPVNPGYALMMRNFLGGVADFFLEDSEFSKIESNVVPDDLKFKEGDVFISRLKFFRSTTGSLEYSNEKSTTNTQDLDADPFTEFGMRPYVDGAFLPTTNKAFCELPQYPLRSGFGNKEISLRETYTTYNRTTAFGPPIAGTATSSFIAAGPVATKLSGGMDAYRYRTVYDSFTGCNPAFTDCSKDGEGWVDFVFRPTASISYDLERILAETKVKYWRFDPGYIISGSTQLIFDAQLSGSGVSLGGSTYHYTASAAPYSGRVINQNSMQMSASFNLFGVENVQFESKDEITGRTTTRNTSVGKRWVIQSKFETPALNFSEYTVRPLTASLISLPSYAPESTPIGMWHQFGLLPEPNQGLFLEFAEPSKDWLRYHYDVVTNDSIYNDFNASENGKDFFKKAKSFKDLFGFNERNQKTRIGGLKEKLVVKEAIVAIPYTQSETSTKDNLGTKKTSGTKKFINIPMDRINASLDDLIDTNVGDSLSAAGKSIREQVERMQEFVIPPQFDFLKNRDIKPLVMYIIPFEYEFDRNDLSYIWQNIAPRDYKKVTFQEKSVCHMLANNELFSKDNLIDNDNLHWMVFKVKQNVRSDYYDKVISQAGQATSNDFINNKGLTSESGILIHNWPYDYFSFIELGSMDVEVLYKPDMSNQKALSRAAKFDNSLKRIANPVKYRNIKRAELTDVASTGFMDSGPFSNKKIK